MQLKNKKGFSLIELLTVMAIIAVLTSIAAMGISGMRKKSDIEEARSKIVSILGDARNRAVNQEDGEMWGVRFVNSSTSPYFSLFYSNYSTSTEKGRYSLPSNVEFVTSTIPLDAYMDIVFLEISGRASGTGNIPIRQKVSPFTTSTIVVSSSGAISF